MEVEGRIGIEKHHLIATSSGGSAGFQAEHLPGYALALLCALTWSGYSVLSRRLGDTPTSSVAVFCIATAIAIRNIFNSCMSVPCYVMINNTNNCTLVEGH